MTSWPPASIRLRRQDLQETVEALDLLAKDAEDSVRTALSRYLVVRSAGFVEAVRDDLADFFSTQISVDLISNRVRSGLRSGQGVRPSQLVDFVKTFHSTWGVELDALLDVNDKRLRSELGSLVNARKKIAHGDGDSVTTLRALGWASASQEIGAWLIKRFDPSRDFYNTVTHV